VRDGRRVPAPPEDSEQIVAASIWKGHASIVVPQPDNRAQRGPGQGAEVIDVVALVVGVEEVVGALDAVGVVAVVAVGVLAVVGVAAGNFEVYVTEALVGFPSAFATVRVKTCRNAEHWYGKG
jgi:hypothetical protein